LNPSDDNDPRFLRGASAFHLETVFWTRFTKWRRQLQFDMQNGDRNTARSSDNMDKTLAGDDQRTNGSR
jgi:hypothetical protein